MLGLDNVEVNCGGNCEIQQGVIFLPSERDNSENLVTIGENVTIRTGSIVYAGTKIGSGVTVDHYCIIREGVNLGERCRIRNNTEIGRDVEVGVDCILSGFIANRVKIGKNTSSFGQIVHTYPNHGEGFEEDSPEIGDEVIVGTQAVVAGGIIIGSGVKIRAGQVYKGAFDNLKNYGVPLFDMETVKYDFLGELRAISKKKKVLFSDNKSIIDPDRIEQLIEEHRKKFLEELKCIY